MPGGHDTPLPMGKYYPSNYEHHAAATTQSPTARSPRMAPSGGKSDGQQPKYKPGAPSISEGTSIQNVHGNSDARRRLQQYQRDMVAQATLAAKRLLVNKGAGSKEVLEHAGVALLAGGVHMEGTMSAHKPISPRLAPLGSPGPVTPINLEDEQDVLHGGGYLTKGRTPYAGREVVQAGRTVKGG